MKMMQGDSYLIFIKLEQNGLRITPDLVEDLEICVGDALQKRYSEGSVGFDGDSRRWFVKPTQEETLGMSEDSYDVIARVKYKNSPNADVKGVKIGKITILGTYSEEVL